METFNFKELKSRKETLKSELEKKLNIGLTSEEVNEKIQAGLVNGELDVKTKSIKQIVKDNLLTLFNLVK